MPEVVLADWLTVYERALDLVWPVTYWHAPEQATCRVSSAEGVGHEVWLPTSAVSRPQMFLCDIVHELCHAKLAESVGISFSCLVFAREYGQMQGKDAHWFARASARLYWAWCHVDLWVNDLRHTHWPEMTKLDNQSFVASVAELANRGQWDFLASDEAIFGMAQCRADLERRGMPAADFARVLSNLNASSRQRYHALLSIYKSLSALSGDGAQDLKMLEQSVRRVAQALKLHINPRLVEEEGMKVWRI